MAKYDPSGATGYSAEDAEDADDAAPSIPFPDPFGPYPDKPYPGVTAAAEAPRPSASTDAGATPVDDLEPPTDPGMAPVTFDDGFDPFAASASWFPERPWYRKSSATVAFAAIGVAVVAIVVATTLLVSRDSGESGGSTPATTSTPESSAPSTTPLTSAPPPEAPPPPPPPPPESPSESAQPRGTWVPQYPQNPSQNGGERPNVTTPQTRPPQISVRPTHRPAFPNQSGGG